MKVSHEGIGESVVTFYNSKQHPAAVGVPVKMSANGEVSACVSGDKFFGVCIACDSEFTAVQTAGYVKLGYTGATVPTVGFVSLAADGSGGAAVNASGREFLVIDVDKTSASAGVVL